MQTNFKIQGVVMAKNFVSNKDETARMFESDFLEAFSKVHFSVPLFIYVPVIAYLFYISIFEYAAPALDIIGLIITGAAVWTLIICVSVLF